MSDHDPTAAPAAEAAGTPARGMGAVLRESEFSAADAVGGPRGILESVLPTLVFVVLFVTTRALEIAAGAAVAVCAIALLARIVQRQALGPAIGGLVGVGIGAVWAVRSGDGTTFYLPGIAINALTALVVLVSLLARRPLVALVAALFDPRVADWAQDPDAVRTYRRATWLLLGLYAAKTAVQGTLLVTGAVAALGLAKLAMGLPLFALVVWIIWGMHQALLRRRGTAGTGPVSSRR